jgi:pterin-4a-carbinolamine dehydratase
MTYYVHSKRAVPVVTRDVFDLSEHECGGIADQDVDTAKSIHGGFHR